MTYVVTKPCIGTKDRSCVEVCPVDCFYDIKKKKYNEKYGVMVDDIGNETDWGMLMIHPDECINCGACETECPVEAIYEDSAVPEDVKEFLEFPEEELDEMTDEELDNNRVTAKG